MKNIAGNKKIKLILVVILILIGISLAGNIVYFAGKPDNGFEISANIILLFLVLARLAREYQVFGSENNEPLKKYNIVLIFVFLISFPVVMNSLHSGMKEQLTILGTVGLATFVMAIFCVSK